MDSFSSACGSVFDQKPSFNHDLYQPQSSSSSGTPETPFSVLDGCSDSSASSPEAMMPYHQPWAVEPAMNCPLLPSQSPIEPPLDGLPRIIPPMGRIPAWSGPLEAPSYSSFRQLRPETRRLPAGKHSADWVHANWKTPEASFSLYKPAHTAGSLSPHSQSQSQSSSLSTNPTTTAGLSAPSTTSMQYTSFPLSAAGSPIKLEMDREVAPPATAKARASPDEMDDTNADPPYSQLIYEALSSAPGKKLPLQGIYLWFEKNTAKGRDPGSKGWQNSIRHNLSMNAGFEAVREEQPTAGKKPINYWRLTDEAVSNGIQSTTRYRKQTNYRKPSDPPAFQHQRCGAKGGKATKVTAKFRSAGYSLNSMSLEELRRERACRQQLQQQHQIQRLMSSQRPFSKNFTYSQYPNRSLPTTSAAAGTTVLSPAYAGGGGGGGTTMPTAMPTTRPSAVEGFNLGDVVGCANANAPSCTVPAPIFCDMEGPAPDCLVFDAGFMGMDGIHSSFAGSQISTPDLHIGL
ncbi:hypothetical protein BDW62DRAFT_198501 [Aspergillus aurantiobrunneus]